MCLYIINTDIDMDMDRYGGFSKNIKIGLPPNQSILTISSNKPSFFCIPYFEKPSYMYTYIICVSYARHL